MIGLSTAQIGFGLSLAGVAGLLALVPVGVQAWRAGWFAVYPFVPGMALFVLVAAAVGTAAAFRRYAPADRRSAYLSVYTLGATDTGIAGPLLVTVAVVDRGVRAGSVSPPCWPLPAPPSRSSSAVTGRTTARPMGPGRDPWSSPATPDRHRWLLDDGRSPVVSGCGGGRRQIVSSRVSAQAASMEPARE